jgi:hypothetical protein
VLSAVLANAANLHQAARAQALLETARRAVLLARGKLILRSYEVALT